MRVAAVVALLALLGTPVRSQQAGGATGPKLVVIVVVDQLRFDYLDRFAGLWKHGFHRLLSEGAVFDRAFYPYLNTVTCAGHATISTGTYPSTHGIILNEWWQRAVSRRMSCTDDPEVTAVAYSTAPAEKIGHSAHRLRVPTLADRLRARTSASRVASVSLKPRSTVMLAGHGGDAVTWLTDTNTWGTSTAYSRQRVAVVDAFLSASPVEADRASIWDRVLEPQAYRGTDDGLGERPRAGWTNLFPHPLAGTAGTRPEAFYDLWERSPYADAYVGRMAASLVQSLQLGQREAVDYLGVSFSALDYVGHDFGPDSQEVQDALLRLDVTLGAFLDMLDATTGGRFVVGLSADHGVSPIPEQWKQQGGDAGRVLNASVRKVAEAAMVAAHGAGPHVAHVEYSTIYLTPSTRRLVDQKPDALEPLLAAVAKIPGILRVMPARGLEGKRTSSDPVERAAALSYHPAETGEVVLAMKPYWINTDSSAATHGTLHPYDQHVPVILLGGSFKPGRYSHAATPADLAPTLAHTINLAMPAADGRVLIEALR